MKTTLLIAIFLSMAVVNTQAQSISIDSYPMPDMLATQANVGVEVVINEVDCDQIGTDAAEFVELFGPPNTSLDGLVVVFYNGSSDVVYNQFDLNGYSLDEDGFFVLGNSSVEAAEINFPGNSLQNGADAVVIYQGSINFYPDGTPISLNNIVDAMVYDTGDPDDPALLLLLLNGQPQVDEMGLGQSVTHANARIPDGGQAQFTQTYVQQTPTPGFTNLPVCEGGLVETTDSEVEVDICVDEPVAELFFQTIPDAVGDYTYFLTDIQGLIISQIMDASYDFAMEDPGECRVYGLSYSGTFFGLTLSPGESIFDVDAVDCVSVSENYIQINKIVCTAVCGAGTISSSMGNEVTLCLFDENAALSLSHNSPLIDPEFLYVVVGEDGNIHSIVDGDNLDLTSMDLGSWVVYNVSYIGEPSGLIPGAVFANINAVECLEISDNFISLEIIECEGGEPCAYLFFSEYIEGGGDNQALELYNPTEIEIDLSTYEIWIYSNGSPDPSETISLDGLLPSEGIYILCNPDADNAILQLADQTAENINFDGDDAILLVNNEVGIDVIGVIGELPAEGFWYAGNGSTQDHTLLRGPMEGSSTTSWPLSAAQWTAADSDSFQYIGNHLFIGCTDPGIPIVTFDIAFQEVAEGTAAMVMVQVINPIYGVSVDINYQGGTATVDEDFVHPFPATVNFGEGTTQPLVFSIPIIDDLLSEGPEDIMFMLSSDTDDVGFFIDVQTIVIPDDDLIIPLLTIAEISGMDQNFAGDSLGVLCELRGVVHGVNLNAPGLKFTMIDPTDGISVFHFSEDLGYTVVEGDSVHVIGTIDQFSGLHTINAQAIQFISGANELQNPLAVTVLYEGTESHMVMLECVSLVNPAEWDNQGSGFNADVTNGEETITLYIPSATDVFGTVAPEGVFNVIGIGNQYDPTTPFGDGYELVPRYLEDVSESVVAEFQVTDSENGIEVDDSECLFCGFSWVGDYDLTGLGDEDEYNWNINGIEYSGADVFLELGDCGPPWADIILVSLEVSNNELGCTAQVTQEYCGDVVMSVEEIEHFIKISPNPTDDYFNLSSTDNMESVGLYSVDGRILYEAFPSALNHEIDVSSLAVGTYLVLVKANNTLYQSKIIVK